MTANAGYHAYATGDVLTAAQVQYNLQNQTVMYFATASARTTALSGVVVEGMVSYVPANGLEYYNGSAWVTLSTGGDITAVTAGTGLTGGGTTGAVTLNLGTTAKGDLVAGTGASSAAALTVGANDTVLTADSTAATGLKWATSSSGSSYVAGKNLVINGGFDVWQRGTSFASGTRAYTADRFEFFRNGSVAGATLSRQASTQAGLQYCARVGRDSANTSTAILWLTNSMDSVNCIPYAGKTITFSFYARAGANYSAASSILNYSVIQGTGTDQNLNVAYTGQTDLIGSTNVTLTTSWQRFTASATVASTSTEIGFYFDYTPVGTAGAADYYEITGIQFEAASSATTFSRNGATYQGELASCRRYLPAFVGDACEIGFGYAYGANSPMAMLKFDVVARKIPTGITSAGNWRWYALNTGTVAGVSLNAANQYGASLVNTSGVTITAGQGTRLYGDDSSATIFFTGCEL